MTSTEQRYAQIEKEALATNWACEKFNDFIVGKDILIEADHQPLVPLFLLKNLDDLPPRIKRFKMRLMKYSLPHPREGLNHCRYTFKTPTEKITNKNRHTSQ